MRRGLLLSRHGGVRPILDRLLQQRPEPAYLRVLQPRLPRGLQGHAEERPPLLRQLLENTVAIRLARKTPVNNRVERKTLRSIGNIGIIRPTRFPKRGKNNTVDRLSSRFLTIVIRFLFRDVRESFITCGSFVRWGNLRRRLCEHEK